MVMFIRLLRSVAYMLGVSGALIVLNTHDPFWHKAGWVIVCAMVPLFIAVNVMTSLHNAKAQPLRRRRR